ncbi:hypothetical protein AX768_09115 [Burkholderia sp. PAMC 28687]|uniref:hypothetical protein n=1 Tax=Burkholderia sp. PAMC 28687 TaxID=1795874 RepID=UPI000784E75D|nr:hypothetical protein [Burkholderia sp. PAMC 28687]AMM14229.1 hypothetical protein AX768_09115 [Burkholderia sp. PAMC 28687]
MTTTVRIKVEHVHQDAHVEIHYVDKATGQKTGRAALLQAGEETTVACHAHGDIVIEEVGGTYS